MRSLLAFTLAAIAVLISTGVSAQEVYHSQDSNLFARFSYDTSAIVADDGPRHICVAVSRDGEYRIERTLVPMSGLTSGDGPERLQGKLTREQLDQLKALLDSDQFRAASSNHGGLIRQESESFGAEIQRAEDGAQRLRWLNADGENPFPVSVAKVVDWLKHFDAKNATPFTYAEYPDVCPPGGLRRIQPSMAKNGQP